MQKSYSLVVAALQCSSWNKPRTQSFWGWRIGHSSFLSQFRRLFATVFLFSSAQWQTPAGNERQSDHCLLWGKPLAQEVLKYNKAHTCWRRETWMLFDFFLITEVHSQTQTDGRWAPLERENTFSVRSVCKIRKSKKTMMQHCGVLCVYSLPEKKPSTWLVTTKLFQCNVKVRGSTMSTFPFS